MIKSGLDEGLAGLAAVDGAGFSLKTISTMRAAPAENPTAPTRSGEM